MLVGAQTQLGHCNKHALAIGKGRPGVLHGSKMYLIQNKDGQGVPFSDPVADGPS